MGAYPKAPQCSQPSSSKVQILPSAEGEKAAAPPSETSTAASSSTVERTNSSGTVDNPKENQKSERKGFWPTRRSFSKSSSSQSKPLPLLVETPPPPIVTSSASSEPQVSEVLQLLLQGLKSYSTWNLDTLQVFLRMLLDIFLHPAICHNVKCQTAIQSTLQEAVKNSALLVRRLLQEQDRSGIPSSDGIARPAAGGSTDDFMLDLLLEEWELHKAPHAQVCDVCSNPRCLLLPAAPSTGVTAVRWSSVGNAAEKQGQKAIRSFLLLRRLHMDLQQFAPQVPCVQTNPSLQPWAGASFSQPLPIQVDEEAECAFSENMHIEVGTMERIVCSLATPQGKQTRYLLLHDYWLLLVQPDLAMMGWAEVRTLWPLRSLQSLVDRSDPRTLRLGMHALPGSVGVGEAAMSRSSDGSGGERPGCYLTLSLNFEDVKKCMFADKHLQKRRQHVRAQLMEKSLAFVNEHCVGAFPPAFPSAMETA